MLSGRELCDVFVGVADTLTDQFDLVEFLHTLTDHVVVITGADSAGLLLGDGNSAMRFMRESGGAAAELEHRQLELNEGPCLDCFSDGQAVIVPDLNAVDRWPRFAEFALGRGIQSVHAVPMRLRRETVGALNLFATVALPFDDDDIAVVQALADIATIGLLQERAISSAELITEQLQQALNSRIVIEQAKGFVARTYGVSVDQAFVMLRSYARTNRVRLTDLCRDVLDRKVSIAVRPASPGRPPG